MNHKYKIGIALEIQEVRVLNPLAY